MVDVTSHPDFDAHEDVVFFNDDALGVAGIIAIHSTALGPAVGGCRIWDNTEEAALTDVLRLSRGMTYKNAMADLPLGGGKAVIYTIGENRAASLEKFGETVEELGGRYITAEDVGASVEDMRIISRRTTYVAGLPKEAGQAGGDPSPVTAQGVFYCVKAMLGGDVTGRRIAVQGVGHVGLRLCELLAAEKANLIVADVNTDNLERARALGASIAPVEDIHRVEADLFAPCALGAGLNERTIPELGAPIVCGAANNQLATEADGERLVARGIAYAPDYIVNAGGIINVSAEYLGEPADVVEARIRAIAARLLKVMETAKAKGVPPNVAADAMAREKLRAARMA